MNTRHQLRFPLNWGQQTLPYTTDCTTTTCCCYCSCLRFGEHERDTLCNNFLLHSLIWREFIKLRQIHSRTHNRRKIVKLKMNRQHFKTHLQCWSLKYRFLFHVFPWKASESVWNATLNQVCIFNRTSMNTQFNSIHLFHFVATSDFRYSPSRQPASDTLNVEPVHHPFLPPDIQLPG